MFYSSVLLRLLSSGSITNRCPLLQQYTTLSASRKFHRSKWFGKLMGYEVSSSDSQTAQRLGWSMTEKIPLPARNFHAGGATFRLIAIDAGKTADLVLAGLIAGSEQARDQGG